MIHNIRKNCLGTISFDCKFKGMRKSQDFVINPIKLGDDTRRITIQSATRIGYVDTQTGAVSLSPPVRGGAYFEHLSYTNLVDTIGADDLAMLKASIISSAAPQLDAYIITDNRGAATMI